MYIARKADALIQFLRGVIVFLCFERELAAANAAAMIGNGR